MKIFSKKVDLRSRKQMIEYLKNHYRYNTMNSWNQSTSYANNVKIYNLDFSSNEQNKLYELVEMSEFYDRLSYHFYEFARKHNFYWQAGFNGRSGGYIVLYQGFSKKSEYKSYCTSCGQRNYKTIEETGNCRCGKCGITPNRQCNTEHTPVNRSICMRTLRIGIFIPLGKEFHWFYLSIRCVMISLPKSKT